MHRRRPTKKFSIPSWPGSRPPRLPLRASMKPFALWRALADAVDSVLRSQDSSQRLAQADVALEQERKANEWNAQVASQQTKLESAPPSKDANAAAQWAKEQQLARDMAMQP